jgi:DNA-binding MarR family transcriptional regulator
MDDARSRPLAVSAAGDLVPRLLTGLVRLGMLLRSDGLRRGRAVGLTPTQRQILLLLRTRRRPLRLAEVAGALELGSPTVSAAVGALVRKGAVVREREDGDRRALALRLTPAGASARRCSGLATRAAACGGGAPGGRAGLLVQGAGRGGAGAGGARTAANRRRLPRLSAVPRPGGLPARDERDLRLDG